MAVPGYPMGDALARPMLEAMALSDGTRIPDEDSPCWDGLPEADREQARAVLATEAYCILQDAGVLRIEDGEPAYRYYKLEGNAPRGDFRDNMM